MLVRNQLEAVKSPFKLEFFTEPRSQCRTNPLRLKPKRSETRPIAVNLQLTPKNHNPAKMTDLIT